MKRIALIVALFLGACGGEDPAGPAVSGSAGTGTAGATSGSGGTGGLVAKPDATGAAGAGSGGIGSDPCTALPRCSLSPGQTGFIVGASHKEYSSPSCPARICVPCGVSKAGGGSVSIGGCSLDSSDGTHEVYCDDSKSVVAGTDCN